MNNSFQKTGMLQIGEIADCTRFEKPKKGALTGRRTFEGAFQLGWRRSVLSLMAMHKAFERASDVSQAAVGTSSMSNPLPSLSLLGGSREIQC